MGAFGELLIAADLIRKGFNVYRALSPSSPSDLIIQRNGKLITVECRTGYRTKNGEIKASKQRFRSEILAVIVDNGKHIEYSPKLQGETET